jgi:hypothetical protein
MLLLLLRCLYPAAAFEAVVVAARQPHKGRTRSRNRRKWPREGWREGGRTGCDLLLPRAGRGAHEGMQTGGRKDGRGDRELLLACYACCWTCSLCLWRGDAWSEEFRVDVADADDGS